MDQGRAFIDKGDKRFLLISKPAPLLRSRRITEKQSVKTILFFTLPFSVFAFSGCDSTGSSQYTQRGPVWVLPVTNTTSSVAAPENANNWNNNTPPVPNVLSLSEIKEMTAKSVSATTILKALRASRAIYTLTTKDVIDLKEAKVTRTVIDYLLSTPLLYKDDLLRDRSYYYYAPNYPYWHWLFHNYHHSYGHTSHHGDSQH